MGSRAASPGRVIAPTIRPSPRIHAGLGPRAPIDPTGAQRASRRVGRGRHGACQPPRCARPGPGFVDGTGAPLGCRRTRGHDSRPAGRSRLACRRSPRGGRHGGREGGWRREADPGGSAARARPEQRLPRGARGREPLLLRQRRAARRPRPRGGRRSSAGSPAGTGRLSTSAWRAAALVFAAGTALGAVLTRDRHDAALPPAPLRAHRPRSPLGALLALAAGLRRAGSVPLAAPSAGLGRRRRLLALATPVGAARRRPPPAPARHREPGRCRRRRWTARARARGGPFFPSSAETNVGGPVPSNFFMTSEDCARCHRDIYDQWNSSAHHFASFNNQWYRKSIEYMQDVVGTKPSKWCAGCHDHAVALRRQVRPADPGADRHARGAGRARAARRATRSCTSRARWGRATSRSSTRRSTTSR